MLRQSELKSGDRLQLESLADERGWLGRDDWIRVHADARRHPVERGPSLA